MRRFDGAPAESWWAKPMTRDAFNKAIADEQDRMSRSRFGQMQSLTTGGQAPAGPKKPRESIAQDEE